MAQLGFDADGRWRSDVPRDHFALYQQYDVRYDAMVLNWRSHHFDISGGLQLRSEWARRCDPIELCSFLEEMIARQLFLFSNLQLRTGHEMAQALMPFWEREIHHKMEEMERRALQEHGYAQPIRDNPDDALFDGLAYGMGTYRVGNRQYVDPFAPPPINEKARKKAEALLLKNLSTEQAASYASDKKFALTGKDGNIYVISHARSFNVKCVSTGKKYCGQLSDAPIEDQMLAQKLLLEHDPDKFFKNANVSGSDLGLAGFSGMANQYRGLQNAALQGVAGQLPQQMLMNQANAMNNEQMAAYQDQLLNALRQR